MIMGTWEPINQLQGAAARSGSGDSDACGDDGTASRGREPTPKRRRRRSENAGPAVSAERGPTAGSNSETISGSDGGGSGGGSGTAGGSGDDIPVVIVACGHPMLLMRRDSLQLSCRACVGMMRALAH